MRHSFLRKKMRCRVRQLAASKVNFLTTTNSSSVLMLEQPKSHTWKASTCRSKTGLLNTAWKLLLRKFWRTDCRQHLPRCTTIAANITALSLPKKKSYPSRKWWMWTGVMSETQDAKKWQSNVRIWACPKVSDTTWSLEASSNLIDKFN